MRFLAAVSIACGAALIASGAASAQTSFTVGAGATIPAGQTADLMKTGVGAVVGVGIKPALRPLGASIEGLFSSLAFKTTAGQDSTRRIVGLSGNIILSKPGSASLPYLIGGLAFYSSKITGDVLPQEANEDLGFNAGAGYSLALREVSTFLEVRYHRIASETGPITLIPITVGLRF